jgi:hypothetical protein
METPHPYDFDAFLSGMAKLDYHEILQEAESESAMAERELGSASHIQRVR